jgi:hypothetical protein
MLMMLARKPVEGERLFDGFLDPSDEFWIAGRPFGDPSGEILAGLIDRTAVPRVRPLAGPRTGSEPAQFLQAVVVGLSGQVIESVAQEVDVAALERGFGKDFADG